MNSAFRLLAGGIVWLGLALAAAPSQAISVIGNLGWQAVPATCSVANNVRFTLADRKLRFQCGPSAVQFACTPTASVIYGVATQQVSVVCQANTVSAVTSTRTMFQGGPTQTCDMTNFDFDRQERTVSFRCSASPGIQRTCYAESLPPVIDFLNATVSLGYCPDADIELVGHSGFEEGELWRPTFGASP